MVTRSLPLSTYSDSGVGQRGAVGHSVELPLSRCQARAPRTCLRPGLRGRGGAETALCSPGFGAHPGGGQLGPGRRDQDTEPLRYPCRALPTCVGHSPKPQSCRNSFYFVFKRCVHFLGHLTNTHTHTRTRARELRCLRGAAARIGVVHVLRLKQNEPEATRFFPASARCCRQGSGFRPAWSHARRHVMAQGPPLPPSDVT